MWSEILGAVVLLGMVIVCSFVHRALPEVIEAWCDRIRCGAQDSDDLQEEEPEESEKDNESSGATRTAGKPVAAAAKTPRAAA